MNAWLETLCVLADDALPAYWLIANGSEFWWTPERSQLGADRFINEPFAYSEIVSITVFDSVPFKSNVWTCDFESLREKLSRIDGLRVEESCDLNIPPAAPPNRALHLTRFD